MPFTRTGFYGDGWMQIEGAIPKDGGVVTSYQQNFKFLKHLFSKKA
jgi:hypothetical protein